MLFIQKDNPDCKYTYLLKTYSLNPGNMDCECTYYTMYKLEDGLSFAENMYNAW